MNLGVGGKTAVVTGSTAGARDRDRAGERGRLGGGERADAGARDYP